MKLLAARRASSMHLLWSLALATLAGACVRLPQPMLADGALSDRGDASDDTSIQEDAADADSAAGDATVIDGSEGADADAAVALEASVGYREVAVCPARDAGAALPEPAVRCDVAPGCCPAGQLCANGVCTDRVSLHGGRDHMCLRNGGAFTCWGTSRSGATGNSMATVVAPGVPAELVAAGPVYAMSTYGVTTEFIVGASRSVGFLGGRYAFGDTDDSNGVSGREPVMLRGIDRMLSLAQPSRSGVRCGITEGRQVRCWGCGGEGALGGGTVPAPVCASSEMSPAAFTVDLGEPVAQVALANASLSDTSAASVCALTETGRVRCWGANDRGQLGRGNTNPSSTLRAADSTPIAGLLATEIAALDMAFCALRNGTDIVCWGDRGSYGAASMMESRSTPEVLARPSASRLHMLRCGGGTCCALERDTRELWCWGVQDEPNERIVPGLAGAAFSVGPTNIRPMGITAGTIEALGVGDSICVVGRDATMSRQVVCWGENDGAESGRVAAPGTVGFGFVTVSGL